MAYKDTDYMYSSARVRALETKLLTAEKYIQIAEASSETEAVNLIADSMSPVYAPDGGFDLEATLDGFLSETFSLIGTISPDASLFTFLQYEFDANNIKAAIKSFYLGISPDDMMFGCGSVSVAAAENAVRDKDFSAYPKNIAKAAAAAMEAYSASGDPQQIDLLIDRASFADMLDAVKDEPFLLAVVKQKIDYANAVAALRLIDGKVRQYMPMVMIEGGNIPTDALIKADDREKLAATLKFGAAGALGEVLENNRDISLGEFERAADDLLMQTIKKAKYVAFGLPVLCGYLFAILYQAKNLRIVFALRALGEKGEIVRERMRASYV